MPCRRMPLLMQLWRGGRLLWRCRRFAFPLAAWEPSAPARRQNPGAADDAARQNDTFKTYHAGFMCILLEPRLSNPVWQSVARGTLGARQP